MFSLQVQCYDPESNTWLLRANIPIAKRCITAVSLNNLVYVSGGLTKSIFCYDPVEDYWMHVVHTFSKQVRKTHKHTNPHHTCLSTASARWFMCNTVIESLFVPLQTPSYPLALLTYFSTCCLFR